jgi:hypothetical protein
LIDIFEGRRNSFSPLAVSFRLPSNPLIKHFLGVQPQAKAKSMKVKPGAITAVHFSDLNCAFS